MPTEYQGKHWLTSKELAAIAKVSAVSARNVPATVARVKRVVLYGNAPATQWLFELDAALEWAMQRGEVNGERRKKLVQEYLVYRNNRETA